MAARNFEGAVQVPVNVRAAHRRAADGAVSEIRHLIALLLKKNRQRKGRRLLRLPLTSRPWVDRDTALVDRPIWLEHALERAGGGVNGNCIASFCHCVHSALACVSSLGTPPVPTGSASLRTMKSAHAFHGRGATAIVRNPDITFSGRGVDDDVHQTLLSGPARHGNRG